MANLKGVFLHESPHWRTPKILYDRLDEEFHFTFDPSPNGGTDAFFNEWHGAVFVNPPYGPQVRKWLEKGLSEIRKGHASVVVYLLPARTDTKWFHEVVLPNATDIRFIKGRLHFSEKGPAPFPSILVVFKKRLEAFE